MKKYHEKTLEVHAGEMPENYMHLKKKDIFIQEFQIQLQKY